MFYGERGALEYDFVVKPGADPRVIALGFEGARNLELSGAGEVTAETQAGELRLLAPRVYQETNSGARVPVAGRYVRRGWDEIGFEVGAYDAAKNLVIDPQVTPTGSALQIGTYFGGNSDDAITAIALGTNGNVYVAGYSDSSFGFPAAGTPIQPGNNGFFDCTMAPQHPCGDGFVSIVGATGALIYSTFLGGGGTDQVNGIAVDATGKIYVTGATVSSFGGFPTTTGAFNTAGSGGFDVFVSKIDPTVGGLPGLVYSTFIPGSNDDMGNAIAIDTLGNAFVTGTTTSTNYPTNLALQATSRVPLFNGTSFVTSLNATGSGLNFSTYYGGTNLETGRAIALDGNGLIYAGGGTNSTDLCTVKAFQPNNN